MGEKKLTYWPENQDAGSNNIVFLFILWSWVRVLFCLRVQRGKVETKYRMSTGIFALRGQTLEKVSAGGRNEHTLPQMNAQRRREVEKSRKKRGT